MEVIALIFAWYWAGQVISWIGFENRYFMPRRTLFVARLASVLWVALPPLVVLAGLK